MEAVETFLTGVDAVTQRAYREEQRAWRTQDVHYRGLQHSQLLQSSHQRELAREMCAYEKESMLLANVRALWARYKAVNMRDFEELTEKLRQMGTLTALLSGVCVTAFFSFGFDETAFDSAIKICYSIFLGVTVILELNACVSFTLMLASVIKVGKAYVSEEEEAELMWRARQWAAPYTHDEPPPAPRRSLARHWRLRCEARWRTAVGQFLLGVPCFFAAMAFIGVLNFTPNHAAVSIMGVLMGAFGVYTLMCARSGLFTMLGIHSFVPTSLLPGSSHTQPHHDSKGFMSFDVVNGTGTAGRVQDEHSPREGGHSNGRSSTHAGGGAVIRADAGTGTGGGGGGIMGGVRRRRVWLGALNPTGEEWKGSKWLASNTAAQSMPFAWHMEPSIHTAWPLSEESQCREGEAAAGPAGAANGNVAAARYAQMLQLSGVGSAWASDAGQPLMPSMMDGVRPLAGTRRVPVQGQEAALAAAAAAGGLGTAGQLASNAGPAACSLQSLQLGEQQQAQVQTAFVSGTYIQGGMPEPQTRQQHVLSVGGDSAPAAFSLTQTPAMSVAPG